ncbi:MAG: hypothetical protein HY872_01930 [Chloroflexi bacterium]|nr:hypothetical protein [Chloroflexota bacterium]
MSAETVTTIIRRAVAEPEFRGLLFRNASAALAGYDLAEAEHAALTGLNAENFDALAGELEARVSKVAGAGLAIGFFNHP